MSKILGEHLQEKPVMTNDGKNVGKLYQVTMSLSTGSLEHIIVEPTDSNGKIPHFQLNDEGRYEIPIEHLEGVGDYITISHTR